ncbi:MAG: sodium-dependent transporter [Pseudomonadota bacterium]
MARVSSDHEHFSSRWTFILAAVGGAVGLGNIWKFPYEAGQGGGGAFVLVYLGFVFLIGVPVMIGELAIGRRGQSSPPIAVANLAFEEGRSVFWSILGWTGVLGAFLVLSFYSVIAGWTLDYIFKTVIGVTAQVTAETSGDVFGSLLSSWERMAAWHFLFIAMTVFIIARGVTSGIEQAVTYLMPALFVLLIILVAYALVAGEARQAMLFLFQPDFSKLTPNVVIQALGQAFFSLSLGLGAVMIYGSYLPKSVSIPRSALIIGAADTVVALLAGLAIFPLVFAYNLDVGSGPGLIFETLPIAFAQMPGGSIFGFLFFTLLTVAAITSSISMMEPMVSYLQERHYVKRVKAAIGVGIAAFVFGLGTVFSFNIWADVKLFDRTFFDTLDFVTNNLLMPLGGLLVALFVGWAMRFASVREELSSVSDGFFARIYGLLSVVCPIALVLVFLNVAGLLSFG